MIGRAEDVNIKSFFWEGGDPLGYKAPNSRSGRNASKTLSSARSEVMGNDR